MPDTFLQTPVEYLKGVGPQKAEILKSEMGLRTFGDLLSLYPFRYEDRTRFHLIKDITPDLYTVQLRGKFSGMKMVGEKRGKRLSAIFRDTSGELELVWFQGIKWITGKFKADKEYIVYGKPQLYNGKWNMAHPEVEEVTEANTRLANPLQPVYPSTEKMKAKFLDSKGIARILKPLAQLIQGKIPEIIPESVLQRMKLMSREQAMYHIHFPANADALQKAQFRLKFEELFFLQLRLLKTKAFRQEQFKGFVFATVGDRFNEFYKNYLPFPLTGAQKRVIREIRQDCGSGKQMNRLLQGDVGSGKTLVALMTMLIALDNGFQAGMMAPTEILANQHYQTLSALLDGMNLKVGLLTGSTRTAQRKELHRMLLSGEMDILIGTHALIEEGVKFKNLGMVVIDEQHRFGVEQRAKLWAKNTQPPHVLVMTATPIPRTLAMTLYGDLDVSVIDEMPPGRKAIKTMHKYDSHRLEVFGFMKEQIKLGRQIYVVYPLIKESEKMDYKDLEDGYESICRAFPLPEYKVSIVHGQQKTEAKEYEMQRFVQGETQIMVATTVIEVGVNVPNASVMIIESAERFGLSQLHQLRGRVGRGADQSYCILLSSFKLSSDAKLRLQTMVRTNDGFEIADTDLRLRGPGDISGTQQSGLLNLKIADLAQDAQILQYARNAAGEILNTDVHLSNPEHQVLKQHLADLEKEQANWSRIS
ncbi:MAG TPA: ATP-dependent DNA helicase RecG [Bacteroidia bacterium]|jgi:ATP-dependent DNA helicase RecG|nr:ATP-dependent DNA helicase RecG [Bacteroidia bacterium]